MTDIPPALIAYRSYDDMAGYYAVNSPCLACVAFYLKKVRLSHIVKGPRTALDAHGEQTRTISAEVLIFSNIQALALGAMAMRALLSFSPFW